MSKLTLLSVVFAILVCHQGWINAQSTDDNASSSSSQSTDSSNSQSNDSNESDSSDATSNAPPPIAEDDSSAQPLTDDSGNASQVVADLKAALRSPPETQLERETRRFASFAKSYKRTYKSDNELLKRFQYFQDNMRNADRLNQEHEGSAVFGVTQWSDWSLQEFKDKILTLDKSYETPETSYAAAQPFQAPSRSDSGRMLGAPKSIDWNKLGKVTPVRNQGSCGSCYAYAGLADVESQVAIKKNQMVVLSTQQVLDCDSANGACQGGWTPNVWQSAYKKGGIMLDKNYPYKGAKGSSCAWRNDATNVKLKSGGSVKSASTSFSAIQDFVSTRGPAAAAIDGTPLLSYRSGILNKSSGCSSINHAVLITGYDASNNYLIVKNSWGTSWGEKGYFRITPTSCQINSYVMGSITA